MRHIRIAFLASFVAIVATAAAETQKEVPLHWDPLYEPGCGGWITSVAVSSHDSKRILVGGDVMGVGLSEDGGESWQSTFGFRMWEINDFTFHPSGPKVAWAPTLLLLLRRGPSELISPTKPRPHCSLGRKRLRDRKCATPIGFLSAGVDGRRDTQYLAQSQ